MVSDSSPRQEMGPPNVGKVHPPASLDLQKLEPSDAKYWTERGRFYTEVGQTDKAAADFAKAKELTSRGTK
jgi:hypothetical protein